MFGKDGKAVRVIMRVSWLAAVLLLAGSHTVLGLSCSNDQDCNDGAYCTGEERCVDLQCTTFSYFRDYPCRGTEADLDCDESSDRCLPATLTVGNASGSPGSSARAVDVSLETRFNAVKTVKFNICDEGDYLSCSRCQAVSRAAGFSCAAAEKNGCCEILIYSLQGRSIEPGSSAIARVEYNVSASAPAGACRDLAAANIEVGNQFNAAIQTNSVAGEFCFTAGPTTTTTTIPLSYVVTISPSAVTVASGTTVRFSAQTTLNGAAVEGDYLWQITPPSVIGSTIDGTGLYTAGTADADRMETVQVIDTAHGNARATASVTVKQSVNPGECTVVLSPLAAAVAPGDELMLAANAVGDCADPRYEWALESESGGSITPEGASCRYTAGENDGVDRVRVTDTVNRVEAEAEITVAAAHQSLRIVSKSTLWKSPWIPIPYLLVVQGIGTDFAPFKTTISFNPDRAVLSLVRFPLVLRDQYLWNPILVLPSRVAGEGDQTVVIAVTTDDRTVTGSVLLREFRLLQNDGMYE